MKNTIGNFASWLVGIYILAHGVLNVMRGNDPEFGIALILASFAFYPPALELVKTRYGLSVHPVLRVIMALVIIWMTLAVGAVNEGYYPEISG